MEQAAKKDMSISFKPEEIMGSEIMKSGEYKYARVGPFLMNGKVKQCLSS
jgi:hypothetical protein